MPDDADKALPLLERAVELEPDYPAAHGLIAWCHEQRYLRGGLNEEVKAAARQHARAAIAAGGDDALALATGGFVIGVVEHAFATALDAIDRSLALSPSSALAYGFSSIIRAFNGDDAIAVAHGEAAVRHSPYDPLIYLPYVGLAFTHVFAGRFDEAIAAANRALQTNPQFSVPCYLRTAALAHLGREAEATESAKQVLELLPTFTITSLVESKITSAERISRLAEGLRKAGLPDR
jgi:tetratricopeptide (TPR) repeat protein